MPKIGMQKLRRLQLIDATLDVIAKYGLVETTLLRISQTAGVSTGIIAHYFGDKNGLLDASMRRLQNELGRGVRVRIAQASSASGCLCAIVDGNFAAEQTSPQATTAWLAFWAQALHDPRLRRLQRVNQYRLRSNLRYYFLQLLPRSSALTAADGLAAMIDGLWLRGALDTEKFDRESARVIAKNYLNFLINNA